MLTRKSPPGASNSGSLPLSSGSGQLTRSEAALARAVLIHGPISRATLTTQLGLSPASLTRLAKPFLDHGLLVEHDEVADGVGRPSRPLAVARSIGAFLGVKLTGDAVHAVLTDVHAQSLGERILSLADHRPDTVVDTVAAALDTLTPLAADLPLRGIGVTLGGFTDGENVTWASFLGWGEVALGPLLAARTGLPVRLENDVIALAEAERWFGVGRDLAGFAVITIGAGVGYGLVANGEVVHTPDAGVGTGGHIPLTPHGPLCTEGHRGCAQAMLTIGSLTAQASAALQRPVDYDELLRLATTGDPAARSIVTAAAQALGRLIALAANLTLSCDVVLAGEGLGLFALAEDEVRAAVVADRHPRAAPVRLHPDETGFTAWARGAAAVAIQSAFERL